MGVELHIVRASGPISMEEWEQTVERRADLKFQSEDLVAVNPATGERITIPPRRGSTLLLVNGEWLPSFYWSHGEISFKAVAPALQVGRELAAALGAEIVTDDREPLGPPPSQSPLAALGGAPRGWLLAASAGLVVLAVLWRIRQRPDRA